MARDDGSVRFFHGAFVRIRQVGVEDQYRILRAVVAPKLWLAQQTRDCRIFPPATIPELIKQVVLSPSGVFITGSTVFINTGGAPQPADAPLTIQDPTLETPIDAASATSGLPDIGGGGGAVGGRGSGGGGGGGGARTRTSRTVPLQRAPNPPPPPPLHPTIVAGATGPQAFLTIQWGQEKTYCGGPASLSGTTSNYPDGSAETAEVRNVVDGATVVGVPLGISGNAFNQDVEVKDWLPRKSGDDYETSRDEDAFAAGQKTPKPLTMTFVPTLTPDDCTLSSRTGVGSSFRMGAKNYVCLVSAGMRYVEGFMGEMVNLGATAPAGTKGDINVNMGAADDKTLSGNDWRYSKVDDHGDRQYWDGASWQAVPAKWSDKPIGTKLLGLASGRKAGSTTLNTVLSLGLTPILTGRRTSGRPRTAP